jgi:hypothetical protein
LSPSHVEGVAVGRLDAPDTIPDRDPALIVGECGAHYRCPTLEALRKHITQLTCTLQRSTAPVPQRVKASRDLELLQRRYAQWVAKETAT